MALTADVADHLCLSGDEDPYWSDSSWFSWAIPERGINGFFYNHFRPNMNCFLGGPAMWDETARSVHALLAAVTIADLADGTVPNVRSG